MSRYRPAPNARDRAEAAVRELRSVGTVLWALTIIFAVAFLTAIGLGLAGTDLPEHVFAALFGGLVSVAWFAAMARGLGALVEVSLPPESGSWRANEKGPGALRGPRRSLLRDLSLE